MEFSSPQPPPPPPPPPDGHVSPQKPTFTVKRKRPIYDDDDDGDNITIATPPTLKKRRHKSPDSTLSFDTLYRPLKRPSDGASCSSSKKKPKHDGPEYGRREVAFCVVHPRELRPHEPYDCPLAQWLAEKYVNDPPVVTFRPKTCISSTTIVKDYIKCKIRELITFVYVNQRNKFCLEEQTFKLDNVVLSRGQIVFKSVFTKPKTEPGCEADFNRLARFIEEVFFQGVKRLPRDIIALLALLKSGKAREQRLLINDHISLMKERSAREFVVQWHDLTKQFSPYQKASFIQACQKLPFNKTWTAFVKGSVALKKVFNIGQAWGNYNQRDVRSQPHFFRNFMGHFIDHCKKDEVSLLYTYDDGLDILKSEFEEEIALFPQFLEEEGLLHLYKPHKSFD